MKTSVFKPQQNENYAMNHLIQTDKHRSQQLPIFQKFLRLLQSPLPPPIKLIINILYKITAKINCIEIYPSTQIGEGLYIGHPYCITINPKAILGKNINIHKGATIGQENRGARQGVPTIGNCVYIGINSTIVGKITIGDDVLIGPNTHVNCDIPSHSIVVGNPCTIKHCDNATEGYVNNKI